MSYIDNAKLERAAYNLYQQLLQPQTELTTISKDNDDSLVNSLLLKKQYL